VSGTKVIDLPMFYKKRETIAEMVNARVPGIGGKTNSLDICERRVDEAEASMTGRIR
jgi:hypothetical protein